MLFYLETNSKSGKIYLIATMKYTYLLVATVNWHKPLKSAKISNIALLPCLFMILLAVSMITLIMLYHILARFELQFIYLLYLIISVAWQAWHRNSKMSQPPKYQEMGFSLFAWHLEKPFRNHCIQKTKMSRSVNDSFAGWSQKMVTIVNLIDKVHHDLFYKRLILHANMEICCSVKSFAGGNCGFSYREDPSCISQVVLLRGC